MRLASLVVTMSLLPGVGVAQDVALESPAVSGQRALGACAYTTAVYLLKRAVTLEPKHPSAWKDLCRADLALDRVDDAVASCRQRSTSTG